MSVRRIADNQCYTLTGPDLRGENLQPEYRRRYHQQETSE